MSQPAISAGVAGLPKPKTGAVAAANAGVAASAASIPNYRFHNPGTSLDESYPLQSQSPGVGQRELFAEAFAILHGGCSS